MATHFKWYGSNTSVTVPYNAVYTYPSQANKTVKSTPRLPPKNGGTFGAGQEIRIELPAMGYLHGGNTTLSFDVSLIYTPVAGDTSIIRFQNNIQTLFNRVGLMYGSTPVEDVAEYNQIIRSMSEWTTTGDFDQGSVAEGLGHSTLGHSGLVVTSTVYGEARPKIKTQKVNIRQAYVQGISLQKAFASDIQADLAGDGFGLVPYSDDVSLTTGAANVTTARQIVVTRRYCVQLNLGVLLQGKLVPVKYMASQLAISIRLAADSDAIFWQKGYSLAVDTRSENYSSTPPTYQITNVNLIPEILEFDSSYDESFLEGLQQGVPLLFSSFNTFQFSSAASTQITLSVPERNRSIKSVFTMQKRSTSDMSRDHGATFYTTAATFTAGAVTTFGGDSGSTLQEYQYRIGGRYFPASPVQCSTQVGGSTSNGAAEAYVELAKALNTLGDFRLSTPLNVLCWATPPGVYMESDLNKTLAYPEYDGAFDVMTTLKSGLQALVRVESPGKQTGNAGTSFAGRSGAGINSCCFTMAINLETSNGMEISGLNAEEQSDISITMRWSHSQSSEMMFLVYTYYDAMLILFENNVVQLIK